MHCLNCGTGTWGTYCANCTAYARQNGTLPPVTTLADDPEVADAVDPEPRWAFRWRGRAR